MKPYKLCECCSIIVGRSPESKYYNTNGDTRYYNYMKENLKK